MFKDADELKEFIVWAKSQGIQQVKVKGVDVTFSQYTMLKQYEESQSPSVGVKEMAASQPKTEEELRKEEEDLLFHSSIS